MTRLMLESLEDRDLMSAGVLLTCGVSEEPRTAVIAELDEFVNTAVNFMAPIGSDKGSLTDAVKLASGETISDAFQNLPRQNGIIAILIGLREPTQPGGPGVSALTAPLGSTKGSVREE